MPLCPETVPMQEVPGTGAGMSPATRSTGLAGSAPHPWTAAASAGGPGSPATAGPMPERALADDRLGHRDAARSRRRPGRARRSGRPGSAKLAFSIFSIRPSGPDQPGCQPLSAGSAVPCAAIAHSAGQSSGGSSRILLLVDYSCLPFRPRPAARTSGRAEVVYGCGYAQLRSVWKSGCHAAARLGAAAQAALRQVAGTIVVVGGVDHTSGLCGPGWLVSQGSPLM